MYSICHVIDSRSEKDMLQFQFASSTQSMTEALPPPRRMRAPPPTEGRVTLTRLSEESVQFSTIPTPPESNPHPSSPESGTGTPMAARWVIWVSWAPVTKNWTMGLQQQGTRIAPQPSHHRQTSLTQGKTNNGVSSSASQEHLRG